MLNRSDDSGHPCLVLDLRGISFSLSPLSLILIMGFSYIPFIRLQKLPSILSLLSIFIMKLCWILSDAFFCICWDDHVVFVLYSMDVMYYINWFSNPQDHLQDQWVTRRTHRIQYVVILTAKFYYIVKGYRAKSAKRNSTRGKVQRKPTQASRVLSQWRQHRTRLIPPTSPDNMWNIVYHGSSFEIQCPGFLIKAGHIGMLCLARIKIPDSQKESRYLA